MAKKHVWRIKKEYFRQLKNGEKKLEIRVGYPAIKKVKEGDFLSFENYGDNCFLVKRVSVYDSFNRMLEVEAVKNVLPGMTKNGALKILRNIYPPEKEKLGVYVFELVSQNTKEYNFSFTKLSSLIGVDNKLLSELIHESYKITDWISSDYPKHCDLFYCKYVPGIFSGEREIFICKNSHEVIAVAFLKKDSSERKISTLYVKPDYQGKGIASKLLEMSFEWLETTRPLITIADYKLPQFTSIIQKYNWKATSVLENGYYNNHSQEHVFNG